MYCTVQYTRRYQSRRDTISSNHRRSSAWSWWRRHGATREVASRAVARRSSRSERSHRKPEAGRSGRIGPHTAGRSGRPTRRPIALRRGPRGAHACSVCCQRSTPPFRISFAEAPHRLHSKFKTLKCTLQYTVHNLRHKLHIQRYQ